MQGLIAVLTHGDCCILEQRGMSHESHYIEVTLGAYTLTRGMDTTHWISASRAIPNAATRIGVKYFVDRDYVEQHIKQQLAFCIIQLDSPVSSDFTPLTRGKSFNIYSIDGYTLLQPRVPHQKLAL